MKALKFILPLIMLLGTQSVSASDDILRDMEAFSKEFGTFIKDTAKKQTKQVRQTKTKKTVQKQIKKATQPRAKKVTPKKNVTSKPAQRKRPKRTSAPIVEEESGELVGGETTYSARSYQSSENSSDSKYLKCYKQKAPTSSKGSENCFKGVKNLLKNCGAVKAYWWGATTKLGYASAAGPQLEKRGFKKLPITDPDKAPKGSIVVYDHVNTSKCRSFHRAGHIEVKLANNKYVSDYKADEPRNKVTSCRVVKGIYFK